LFLNKIDHDFAATFVSAQLTFIAIISLQMKLTTPNFHFTECDKVLQILKLKEFHKSKEIKKMTIKA